MMAEAEEARRRAGRRTLLFVDEIHRFNKAQQDAFLPRVEAGDIVLIGATTENPSFEVNSALLSRSKVYVLQAARLPTRSWRSCGARSTDRGARPGRAAASTADDEALAAIARYANGDARVALNLLETASRRSGGRSGRGASTPRWSPTSSQNRALLYDKTGEEHYNLISALHKSMRNSDPDAAVYWLARMLEAGEDPLYVARRLVRFASEDIGNADPQALTIAVAAKEAVHFIGMPEGNTALAQAAIYWRRRRRATRSTSAYLGWPRTRRARKSPSRCRCTCATRRRELMKDLEYGKGYQYAHDEPEGIAPRWSACRRRTRGGEFYEPTNRGREAAVRKRLDDRSEDQLSRSSDATTFRNISGRSGRMNEKR